MTNMIAHGNKIPPLEEVAMGDQVPAVPPTMTIVVIRETSPTLAQAMTSQANVVTSQVKSITTQVKREGGLGAPQHANIVASRLRDFTRINTLMFFRSNSDENPQEILDEVCKILYATGLTSIQKAELDAYKLKDVSLTWYVQRRDNRSPRCGPVTWEIFKMDFLVEFFP